MSTSTSTQRKLAVKLEGDKIKFYDPNDEAQNSCSITLHRTLRIPDDGKVYPLPPSMGTFPVHKVDDYMDKVPEEWKKTGGVFFPMYQREAMWMQFTCPQQRPKALKIAVGKVNAINGAEWSNELKDNDYVVIPKQPWLDGINAGGDGRIKQFVAMPLGSGYSVEAQVTGKEEFGGIQIMAFDSKEDERLLKFPQSRVRVNPQVQYASQISQLKSMGFNNIPAIINALNLTNGNVTAAVEELISSGNASDYVEENQEFEDDELSTPPPTIQPPFNPYPPPINNPDYPLPVPMMAFSTPSLPIMACSSPSIEQVVVPKANMLCKESSQFSKSAEKKRVATRSLASKSESLSFDSPTNFADSFAMPQSQSIPMQEREVYPTVQNESSKRKKSEAKEMSISAGGTMKQEISKDDFGINFWDQSVNGRIYIRIVNSEMYEQITGKQAPPSTISAKTYSSYNYPWFDVYNESADSSITQGSVLNNVKSVKQVDSDKYAWPQQDDSSIQLNASQVQSIHINKNQVRDGDW